MACDPKHGDPFKLPSRMTPEELAEARRLAEERDPVLSRIRALEKRVEELERRPA